MYLSEAEEIVAYIVCIAIVIGFVATTYMEIKNTVAEEKQKQTEKKENEAKIGTLIEYFDSKKNLIVLKLGDFCDFYYKQLQFF